VVLLLESTLGFKHWYLAIGSFSETTLADIQFVCNHEDKMTNVVMFLAILCTGLRKLRAKVTE